MVPRELAAPRRTTARRSPRLTLREVNIFNFGRCTRGGHGATARGPNVWKRFPLGVANVLGPRIVCFIQ